jgi:putative metalloprotease
MLRFAPIILAVLYGYALYRFSAWRTARQLNARSAPLAHPVLVSYCAQMAGALDLPNVKVYIYDVPQINGLASPDGRIFLTRGFIEAYERGDVTAEELASVIAHELGHVALGHSRRRMIDFSSQNAMRTAIAMVLTRFLPWGGAYIANALMSLLAARLSRGDEYEADAYAAALLTKSGIGTGPQISLFEKLDKISGAQKGQAPAWLLSHPKTSERIKAIENKTKNWQ